ncbi:MAG: MFS transporter [Gammaproteobacteria bacterium]|nr:MFS transporter [Gammaproteobacteria bacterium]
MSKNTVLLYSGLGHAYFHMLTAFYFVIVLSLEVEWRLPYHQLVDLWTVGALLVGVFAVVAGWLGDKWSANGMLVVFFLGMGLSSIAAGFAAGPFALLLALSGLGLFAAIYHPVGIPLVIRSSGANRGKALAFNGVFGSFGAAMAGAVTGFLADRGGSFLAFVLPGAVVMLTGVAMLIGLARAQLAGARREAGDGARDAGDGDGGDGGDGGNPGNRGGRANYRLPFFILMFCLTAAGLIYHATQTVLPKAFSVRLGPALGTDLKTVGWYVMWVYIAGGLFQFVGGALADRYDLKRVYLAQFVLHALLLTVAAQAGGAALVVVMCAAAAVGAGVLPAESMLVARYTPNRHYGLVFGLKFLLFFGTGPVAVLLVSTVNRHTGQFVWVFLSLALVAAVICAAALLLPRQPPFPAAVRRPAEVVV